MRTNVPDDGVHYEMGSLEFDTGWVVNGTVTNHDSLEEAKNAAQGGVDELIGWIEGPADYWSGSTSGQRWFIKKVADQEFEIPSEEREDTRS